MKQLLYIIALALFVLSWSFSPAQAQASEVQIQLLDKTGAETTRIVDGNTVQLRIKLPGNVDSTSQVSFFLDNLPDPVAVCTIPSGSRTCTSDPVDSLGWYWNPGGVPAPGREINAEVGALPVVGNLNIQVAPRPVVMVHGFLSSWETWSSYLGPGGFLSSIGIPGFAVGDGQVPGVLNTGVMSDPSQRTNTIAQNAEILSQYISAVQEKTGAEKVDLLVHSMGGMISRYYLDRVMTGRNIGQLIILGTPNAGSACVGLAAALGFYLPGSLEILPGYMTGVFNQQITRRHGVPFYALAGTFLLDPISAPCTDVPSDTVVGFGSLQAISLQKAEQVPLMHHELTPSAEVFEKFVRPLLQTPPGASFNAPEPGAVAAVTAPLQFARIYTGHVNPGESIKVVINIDADVAVASFALFDDTHSLDVSVQGASGKTIQLDPVKNGLIKVDDPDALIYLGYGFNKPKPGQWVVTLLSTASTPAQGANFAITARFDGGAQLRAETSSTLPALNEPVQIRAALVTEGTVPVVSTARAVLRKPDGSTEAIDLQPDGESYLASYTPTQIGLYGVQVSMQAQKEGLAIDRGAFIVFEVQPPVPTSTQTWVRVGLLGAGILLVLVVAIAGFFWLIRRKKSNPA
jgi:pimeloyl-ACP methyl ester carboxylesterase